jgi:hypothetical protein
MLIGNAHGSSSTRLTAATITWEKVDPASIVEIADKHWVLPELGADKK